MRGGSRTTFWSLLLLILSSFALAMVYRWLERGGFFDMDTVRVRGIRTADSSFVCRAVEPLFGTPIWNIELEELRRELADIQGIDSVRVSRIPPRTLLVEIGISEPAFVTRGTGGDIVISSEGEILPARFMSDTLTVVEASGAVPEAVSRALADWFELEDLRSDSLRVRYGCSGISVLVGEDREVLLGSERLQSRWTEYLRLESSFSGTRSFGQVDMRYSNQAVLRMSAADPERGGDGAEP